MITQTDMSNFNRAEFEALSKNISLYVGKVVEMMSESLDSVANPFTSGGNVQLSLKTDSEERNATNSVDVPPLSTSGQGGVHQPTDVQAKLDSLKQWSISTYKCTRQALSEKLGKSQKTVDIEVDQSIEGLRELQRRYATLIGLVRTFMTFFQSMTASQKQLVDSFEELSHREPELREEFKNNAECQRLMVKNGESLINAIQFFMSNLRTLCDKTIEDTLITVRHYETARLEYDAYREDLAALQHQLGSQGGADMQVKIHDAEQNCEEHKKRYESLRTDVQVKIKFLEENRVKVVQKQLLLFHNATTAYFSGNHSGLEAALKQFSIKPKSPNTTGPSFLEQA